tara:strand:- start:2783 stop:5461 length:2679 start_codon:yes stop_codon:yes gene_type:complete
MQRLVTILLITLMGNLPSARHLPAQVGPEGSSVIEIGLALRGLDGIKRVLMIGAHPDDEDTGLLASLARGLGAETAYLSLTRGDGGQNLIGPELGEALGIIRTGELEAARRLDGGQQFFTRAYDYGFSKTAQEAFSHWPREQVLRDIVSVIRTFRPQVIVSVWSGTTRDGHGQHQASGILAREAFDVAADPERFNDLPREAGLPWRADKFYQSVRRNPEPPSVTVPIGKFDPLLGRSYLQLAMESRSQHRSQAMGSYQPLGPRVSGLRLVKSHVHEPTDDNGMFAGIDTTLIGLTAGLPKKTSIPIQKHLTDYRAAVHKATESLDALRPERVAEPLALAYRNLQNIFELTQDLTDVELAISKPLVRRISQVRQALLRSASITIDVRVSDGLVTAGQEVDLDISIWNGGKFHIDQALIRAAGLEEGVTGSVRFLNDKGQTLSPQKLGPEEMADWRYRVHFGDKVPISSLYYLEHPRNLDMYRWTDADGSEGLPRNKRRLLGAAGEFNIHIPQINEPLHIVWEKNAQFVGLDKASGEFKAPVLATPSLSVAIEPGGMVWPQGSHEEREVTVIVRNDSHIKTSGTLSLLAPSGWVITPAEIPFTMGIEGSTRGFIFTVKPDTEVDPGNHIFRAIATRDDGVSFGKQIDIINYPHIERTLYVKVAEMRASVFPVAIEPKIKVGYLTGSGDDGLIALRQIGADAEEVSPEKVLNGDFSSYDVLVLGIRAYETRPDIVASNEQILQFARSGGTVIVQYNKFEYPRGEFSPYKVSMGNRPAPRVTDENSPFALLDPGSPVFNIPNRITDKDFEGWVQERGLYFLSNWHKNFTPLLEFVDPGEEPAHGSLLVAPVGEGVYAYIALSLFRQFPAGVPGAYRLFANLVSLTANEWNAHHRSQ